MTSEVSHLVLDDTAFKRIADIVHSESGIVINQGKKKLLISRLSKRLGRASINTAREYCDLIESKNGLNERRKLISSLTTNVTHFFREEHHFNALANGLLPTLKSKTAKGEPVRMWSAGCSTGEEAYSIAMTVMAACPELAGANFKVLATDIDPAVLEVAGKGKYHADTSIIPSKYLKKDFLNVLSDREFSVAEKIKDCVTFAELNLMQEWPMKIDCDVIFCRNVVIYFDDDTQKKLWRRFSERLSENGNLFIGHSERVSDPASFGLSHVGVTQYARV